VRGCARRGAGAPRVEVRSDTAYEDRPARRNRGSTWRDHLHENFVAQPISRRAQFGIQALHVRPPISTILSPPSDEGIKYWIRSTRLIGHLYNRPPLLSLTLAKSAALEWLSDRLDRPGSEGIQGVVSRRLAAPTIRTQRRDSISRGADFHSASPHRSRSSRNEGSRRLRNRRQARDLLTGLAAAKVSSRSATFSSRAAVCSIGSRAADFARPW
jgi:hypothetical protein